MKYKKILLILIVYLLLCNFDVFAKEVQVFFITEGGSTSTNGFKIVDDYVNRTDGTYCATYKSNGTINKLNSINGASFSIYKSGTNLVSGREWYTYNYSNNKILLVVESGILIIILIINYIILIKIIVIILMSFYKN